MVRCWHSSPQAQKTAQQQQRHSSLVCSSGVGAHSGNRRSSVCSSLDAASVGRVPLTLHALLGLSCSGDRRCVGASESPKPTTIPARCWNSIPGNYLRLLVAASQAGWRDARPAVARLRVACLARRCWSVRLDPALASANSKAERPREHLPRRALARPSRAESVFVGPALAEAEIAGWVTATSASTTASRPHWVPPSPPRGVQGAFPSTSGAGCTLVAGPPGPVEPGRPGLLDGCEIAPKFYLF